MATIEITKKQLFELNKELRQIEADIIDKTKKVNDLLKQLKDLNLIKPKDQYTKNPDGTYRKI